MDATIPRTGPPGEPSVSEARALKGLVDAIEARNPAPGALVRLVAPAAGVDPWALLAEASSKGQPVFAWSDGREGQTILGVGVAAQIDAAGASRFDDASAACSRWREELCDIPIDGLITPPMLAWAGFSFFAQEPAPRSRWAAWGQGRAVVPRAMIFAQGALGGIAIATRRLEGQSAAALALDLMTQLSALRDDIERAPVADHLDAEQDLEGAAVPGEGERDEERWGERVERATADIQAQIAHKIVLARSITLRAQAGRHFALASTMERLRRDHGGAFVFCIGSGDQGFFLGATPEALVRKRGARVSAQVLAGTAPRGETPEEDAAIGHALMESGKDRREHALTAEAIEGALSSFCRALRVANKPRLALLRDVQHLETPVEGVLAEAVDVLKLVGALHPTPAVGGLPRESALQWIRAHEGLERGWYAGPIGWVGAEGDGAFAVAIRSALVQADEAEAFAGAGLVTGSVPEREWRETRLKLETASRALSTAVIP